MDQTEKMEICDISKASQSSQQPTPFSIADILSNNGLPERRHSTCENNREYVKSKNDDNDDDKTSSRQIIECAGDHDNLHISRFSSSRLSSPDLNMARELEILRRNIVHANLSNFGTLPNTQMNHTNFKHVDTMGNVIVPYPESKEARFAQRQQDEALDMSKSKYLGKLINK